MDWIDELGPTEIIGVKKVAAPHSGDSEKIVLKKVLGCSRTLYFELFVGTVKDCII